MGMYAYALLITNVEPVTPPDEVAANFGVLIKYAVLLYYLVKNKTWHTFMQIIAGIGIISSISNFLTPPIWMGLVDIAGFSAIIAYAWNKQRGIK